MQHINIPLYNFTVEVATLKHAQKADKELPDDFGGGVVFWDGPRLCVYVSTKHPQALENLCVHESCHLAFEILRVADVPVGGEDNQEAFAYLCAYLSDCLIDIMRKQYAKETLKKKKGSDE